MLERDRPAVDALASELPDPERSSNVRYNPSFDALRSFSEHLETTTQYGSPSYVSDQRSRRAERTKNAVDDGFSGEDWQLVTDAIEFAHENEMVCVDRMVGRDPEHSYRCRLYVPRPHARIALAWAKLLDPVDDHAGEPDFYTVQLPDHEETRIRVLPDEGVTVVLGSDYTGEAKKSFLRLFMYHTKRKGGLGLHAGSKRVCVRDDDGDLRTVEQLFLGLSGTGKSTLTGHGLWLDEPEGATMLQDDVCGLLADGSVVGSEGNGLYVKTEGLDAAEQPAIYHAATQPGAVLENLRVEPDGTVDFDDTELTSNGRAVVLRSDLPSADEDIDAENADQAFFITRNPLMPPIARLTPEQAAATFMLGESIRTSAAGADAAGEAVRVVGTNPFIIGSEGEEGNRFYDLVTENDVDCYVINTGYLGDEKKDVGVEETVAILSAAARGTIEWTDEGVTELTVPSSVPGMEIDDFRVVDYCEEYERRCAELREERRAYLDTFEELRAEIVEAVY